MCTFYQHMRTKTTSEQSKFNWYWSLYLFYFNIKLLKKTAYGSQCSILCCKRLRERAHCVRDEPVTDFKRSTLPGNGNHWRKFIESLLSSYFRVNRYLTNLSANHLVPCSSSAGYPVNSVLAAFEPTHIFMPRSAVGVVAPRTNLPRISMQF